ncbi:PREDICTED: prosaposin-like [Nelumbo nucifera]|uniref:Prosaposin-like n=1 Tax=Nelumbo nucifera TaxID=4432 RepID=A0A1U8A2U6_NELNU|nr:PREDICTED: prosaposin-like [Nelumbo nucifera]
MNTSVVSLFFALLMPLTIVNARNILRLQYVGISIKGGVTSTFRGSEVSASRVLPSTELSSDLICFSCLEASRMVEKVLNDPELPDKISMLRNEVCHVLPTDLRVKCDEILEMYTNQAIVFLQVYFSEENLCNSTGLCPSDSDILKVASLGKGQQLPEVEPMHDLTSKLVKRLSMSHESTDKLSNNRSCAACHEAMDEIHDELEDPEKKIEVIRALLKACENIDGYVKQCKRMVMKYGPLVLTNLEKYLSDNDLCSMLHVCEAHLLHASE